METPTDARSLLIRDEGRISHAYQDSLGYWTIGVGRMIDRRKQGGLTNDEIDLLLDNDIARKRTQIRAALPWTADLDEVREAVLLSMAFQMGTDGLLDFVHTLAAVRYGKYEEAAQGMLDSLWAKQTPERAQRLSEMMRTGEWC